MQMIIQSYRPLASVCQGQDSISGTFFEQFFLVFNSFLILVKKNIRQYLEKVPGGRGRGGVWQNTEILMNFTLLIPPHDPSKPIRQEQVVYITVLPDFISFGILTNIKEINRGEDTFISLCLAAMAGFEEEDVGPSYHQPGW